MTWSRNHCAKILYDIGSHRRLISQLSQYWRHWHQGRLNYITAAQYHGSGGSPKWELAKQ